MPVLPGAGAEARSAGATVRTADPSSETGKGDGKRCQEPFSGYGVKKSAWDRIVPCTED